MIPPAMGHGMDWMQKREEQDRFPYSAGNKKTPLFNQVHRNQSCSLQMKETDASLSRSTPASVRHRITCPVPIAVEASVRVVMIISPNSVFLLGHYRVTHLQSLHSFLHVNRSVLDDTHKR